MNKNNIKAFEDGATEITFILTDEAIEFLKNAGYDDLLEAYNNALNNDNVVEVFCQMTVAFFTDAVYDLCFKALKTLKRNFKDMQKCTHHINK